MKQIDIVVFDGIDEERLMKDLACIIEGSRYFDQLPAWMDGTLTRSFILDSHNDWFASINQEGQHLAYRAAAGRKRHSLYMSSI